MKIAVYIPAYNAATTLPSVLERIPPQFKEPPNEILVVNNASTDSTAQVVTQYQQEKNISNMTVITNESNLGYGGSQKVGYRRCIERGYDLVAMVHSDGQYAPEMLSELITPMLRGDVDLIFGSRIQGNPLKGGMPLHRFLGNRFLTSFQNFFLGLKLSEYHSGYRVYSTQALSRIPFERLASDYHFDTEIIILMRQYGCRIAEIPIPTHYGDEENFVNIWKYGLDVLVTTFSYWLHKKGLRRSRNWSRILKGASAESPDHLKQPCL